MLWHRHNMQTGTPLTFDYNLDLNLPIFQLQYSQMHEAWLWGSSSFIILSFFHFLFANVCVSQCLSLFTHFKKVLLRKRWCAVFLLDFLPAGSLYIYWLCESDYVITLMARNITTTLYTTIWQQQCWYCVGVLCGEVKLAFYCRTFLL